MRKNKVRLNMMSNKVSYGLFQIFPSTDAVEIASKAGLDFVMFDCEHGPFTPHEVDILCKAANAADITPLARVPDIEEATISSFLDAGLMGIVGPHIYDGASAEKLSRAARYPPRGHRKFNFDKWENINGEDELIYSSQDANDNTLVIALLEDIRALDNIDDILMVEGIDLFTTGPQDIAQSMGLPGQLSHPDVKSLEQLIKERIRSSGRNMCDEIMPLMKTVDQFLMESRSFLLPQQSPE